MIAALSADFDKFPCRDEVPTTPDAHPDDSINTSASGRTHIGATSLDSSPVTSDDESFRDMESWTVTAEMLQQLTDAEKKRQEIINGELTHYKLRHSIPHLQVKSLL